MNHDHLRSDEPYELVRTTCKERVKRLRHLSIDETGLEEFANKIAQSNREVIGSVDSDMFLDTDDHLKRIYFVLIADTINFGSGWFPYLKKDNGSSGAVSIAKALTNYARQYGLPTPGELTELTTVAVAQILGQDTTGEAGELMDYYRIALGQLGTFLIDNYQGEAVHLVEEAAASAGRLISRLIAIPFFNDYSTEGTDRTYFYKRAQITASDIALTSAGQLRPFDDLDRLTIFADNVLPNVLRVEGVLRYSDELNQKIASGKLLTVGESDEVELRAATVVACESLVETLAIDHRVTITPRELDQLLWTMGRSKIYKESPRHRCRCTFY